MYFCNWPISTYCTQEIVNVWFIIYILSHKRQEIHGVRSQHCGYRCPSVKAPGYQYPKCWLNVNCIGLISCRNVTHFLNIIRKWFIYSTIHFEKKEKIELSKIKHTYTAGFFLVSLHWHHNERDGVSNHQPHNRLLNCLFRHRSQKTSKLRVTGLCEGNSPVTGEFPAQRASNAENVSTWWRHHVPIKWSVLLDQEFVCYYVHLSQ